MSDKPRTFKVTIERSEGTLRRWTWWVTEDQLGYTDYLNPYRSSLTFTKAGAKRAAEALIDRYISKELKQEKLWAQTERYGVKR